MPRQIVERDGRFFAFELSLTDGPTSRLPGELAAPRQYLLTLEIRDSLNLSEPPSQRFNERVEIDLNEDDAAIAHTLIAHRERLIERALDEAGRVRRTRGLDLGTRLRLDRALNQEAARATD